MKQKAGTTARGLERANPEDVGLSTERLGRIRTALDREVAAGMLPGAVVAIARQGRLAYLEAIGHRDPASKAPMTTDAAFSIASMTKAMVSAVIMQLVEEGRILLTDPASKYLPELKALRVARSLAPDDAETVPLEREPTVHDLLRHASGFTYRERGTSAAHKLSPGSSVSAAVNLSKPAFLEALAKAPLLFQPGAQWEYGFSSDVLGLIVEAVTGGPLLAAMRDRLWGPLGMTDTAFALSTDAAARYAHAFPKDALTGAPVTVHHATGKAMQWDSGGGGAVSTALDYLQFTQMLLDSGDRDGVRVLGSKTVELMRADHLQPGQGDRIAATMDPSAVGYGFGLGFAVRRQTGIAPMHGSAGDFYWSGVFGTYFWCDPKEQLTCVFMAAAPGLARLRFRQLMRGLVYQAVVD